MNHKRQLFFLVFLCLIAFSLKASYADQAQRIGNCNVPIIPGWQGQKYQSSYIESFTQRHDVGSDHIMIKFSKTSLTGAPVAPEKYIENIVQDQQKQEQNQNSYKLIRYQGRPAYTTETVEKFDRQVIQTKTLLFVDKNSTYTAHIVVRGKNIDKASLDEANKQWNNILANTTVNDANPLARYGLIALLLIAVIGAALLLARKKRLKDTS